MTTSNHPTEHRPYVLASEGALCWPTGYRGACSCGWESIATSRSSAVAWAFARGHVDAQGIGARVVARG